MKKLLIFLFLLIGLSVSISFAESRQMNDTEINILVIKQIKQYTLLFNEAKIDKVEFICLITGLYDIVYNKTHGNNEMGNGKTFHEFAVDYVQQNVILYSMCEMDMIEFIASIADLYSIFCLG